VNGIGFAAVRDFNAFLRYEKADDVGTANPLAGDVMRIYTEVQSQPGRLLNDFRNLGFNQAENGKIVFDGMMQWIAAGDGINMNFASRSRDAPSATGRTSSTPKAYSRSANRRLWHSKRTCRRPVRRFGPPPIRPTHDAST
jgi:hypothetical protein